MTTGFTIPNAPDVTSNDMAEPDAGDFQILQGDLYGVLNGCTLTQKSPLSMKAFVASGWVVVQGAPIQVTGVDVGPFADPDANARFDLVVVDSSGVPTIKRGSGADANPRFPVIPDGFTVLHSVYIPVGTTQITNPLITDKRVMLDMAFKRALPTATTTAIGLRVQGTNTDALNIRADGQMSWLGESVLARISTGINLMRWSAGVTFTAPTTGVIPLATQAVSGQTADLFNALDASGNRLAYVDSSGNAVFANVKRGAGTPEGNQAGRVGDIYLRTDGGQDSIVYVKEQYSSGNPTTGWYPLRRVDPAASAGITPIGGIVMYGGGAAPAGWLLCDGTPVSRTAYASLFAAISTTWGSGDGSLTFNLPNFCGRTAVGTGSGAGLTTRAVGQTGGAETVALSTAQMPSHAHIMNAHDHGAITGTQDAPHWHGAAGDGRNLYDGSVDISHQHNDGSHVHWMPGGLAQMLYGTSTPGGNAINTHAWIPLDGGAGAMSFSWGPTTGGNLQPSATSTAGGSHAHGVNGNTSNQSNDHRHGITPSTPTMQSAGSGNAHENMPPWTGVPFIIRAL